MRMVCEDMWEKNTLAMFDAVSMARDSSYQPFGNNGAVLQDASFLDCSGKMHGSIREILCAFFEGDMLEMRMLGPKEFLKAEG